jgi:CO/xanthine dehydrogenase FAD-binding subunit
LHQTESVLRNQQVTTSVLEACRKSLAEEIQPIDDIRSTAKYRTVVLCNLVSDFLRGLAGERISA